MKKPRSDSKLKLLPEERQAQIIEWINTPKSESCIGGLQHAREQLAADGITTGLTALSEFYSWWGLRQLFSDAETFAEEQTELMKEFNPADTDRAEAFGDYCFLQRAMKEQDPKAFVALGSLRETRKHRELKERVEIKRLEIAERRVVVLENNQAEAKAKLTAVLAASKGGITPETLRIIEEAAHLL
jgi:hypothetical protein